MCNIEKKGMPLSKISRITQREPSKLIRKWSELGEELGEAEGTVYLAQNQEVRLDEAVLRYSCPKVMEDKFTVQELEEMYEINGPCIIITEKGGTYIINERSKGYIDGDGEFLIYRLAEGECDKYNIWVLLAWLKSSVFIWYIYTLYGAKSIYEPQIYNTSLFPYDICTKQESKIDSLTHEILEKEEAFLKVYEGYKKILTGEEEHDKELYKQLNIAIDAHNKLIGDIANQIDIIFLEELGFTEKEKNIIISDMSTINVYNVLEAELT